MLNHALHSSREARSARALGRPARLLGTGTLLGAALAVLPLAHGAPSWAASEEFVSPIVKLAAGAVKTQAAGAPLLLKVERGGRAVLPITNVTRVVTDDVDVARAVFEGSQAFVEGVSTGSSVLEVQTADGRVQKIVVQVVAPGSLPASPQPSVPDTQPEVSGGTTAQPAVPGVNPSADPSTLPGMAPGAPGASPASPIVPSGPSVKVSAPHKVSVRMGPAEDNTGQAVVTVTYQNSGSGSQDVTARVALTEEISYVTNSATGGAKYDNAARELAWSLAGVPSGASRSVSFRVQPLDRAASQRFTLAATVEGADGAYASSRSVPYSFVTTPLLTVFALPDRILAGRVGPVLVDVRGADMQATIDRIVKLGIANGRGSNMYEPAAAAQRAEYTAMMLKGLNLRDLRDVTAIKYVLGRRSLVNLVIKNVAGQTVASLVRNQTMAPGEHTELWDGRTGAGFVAPGRYTYVCTARDNAQGDTTTLSGVINVVSQTPLKIVPSENTFTDVKESDWYAGYLALAAKQNLVRGYPDKSFHPKESISRIEATVIAMRALGLEDAARKLMGKDSGFLDYQDIPAWATGYVNVAVIGKAGGKLFQGYPSNFYLPMKPLRRDEAAMVMQRLIDSNANRRISVSGAMVPGAVVTINNRTVEAADDGAFAFVIDQDSTNPITVSITDARP